MYANMRLKLAKIGIPLVNYTGKTDENRMMYIKIINIPNIRIIILYIILI